MNTCSFTGHRRIKPAHRADLSGLLERAIGYAYRNGCRNFLTGGAIGFDTEAARAVIRYRRGAPDVRLVLVLPCKNQSAHWNAHQTAEYEYTLAEADEIIYVSEEYTDACMRARNYRLASECDMLIAYVERRNSGAAQTEAMARRLGKEVYNIFTALDRQGG